MATKMEANTPFPFLKYNTDRRVGAPSAEQDLPCVGLDCSYTKRDLGHCLLFDCFGGLASSDLDV
jgi:hypothetical protein